MKEHLACDLAPEGVGGGHRLRDPVWPEIPARDLGTRPFTSGKRSTAGSRLEARRVKSLEDENRRLKKLLAEAMLDNAGLKDLLGKNG